MSQLKSICNVPPSGRRLQASGPHSRLPSGRPCHSPERRIALATENRPTAPDASRKCFLDFRHLLAPLLSGRERFLEIDGAETGLVVGLGLGQFVAVRAYDGAYGRVAPAGNGVVHQNDGLDAAGHLDGANGVAEVNHVGLVCPGTGRLFPLHEPELAALVAVADAISVSGDRPRGVKEL